jgi:glycerophosphoryl diester phosphodiesterase
LTPLVVAHRGASWDEPENTIPAFLRAIDGGADYVELDVHAAPDGSLVVVHDRPDGQARLPTLAGVLETLRGRVGVMLDLKHPYRYRRHGLVARALTLLDQDAIVAAFEAKALEEVRRLRPELRTVQHVANVPLRLAAGRVWAASFDDAGATPVRLALARSLGLGTFVYTVNEAARMRELAQLGATAIVSDRPDLLRRTLAADDARPATGLSDRGRALVELGRRASSPSMPRARSRRRSC